MKKDFANLLPERPTMEWLTSPHRPPHLYVDKTWDTGRALLLFDEMAKRAAAKGYQWADLSLTGEYNEDTRPLALNAGAQVYKRYRFYRKEIVS